MSNDVTWHKDSDGWVWRTFLHDYNNTVKQDTTETKDVYIIPRDKQYFIVDAIALMKSNKKDWVAVVQSGGGKQVAGPFETLDAAKAAWRIIYR